MTIKANFLIVFKLVEFIEQTQVQVDFPGFCIDLTKRQIEKPPNFGWLVMCCAG